MVYTRRKFGYRNRRRPFAARRTRPTWRRNKTKRIGQNLGKNVFWFKKAGDITANPANDTIWLRINANDLYPIPSFVNQARSFEQYKVLKVIAKFYPAYVGSETTTATTAAAFRRGNVVTWIDQPPLGDQPSAGQITTIMGFPSARLHQTRGTIKRWMTRPSGGRTADWAYIQHPTALGVPVVIPDRWDSCIKIFGDNFGTTPLSANNRPYFFIEYLFKVVFRSQYRGGNP